MIPGGFQQLRLVRVQWTKWWLRMSRSPWQHLKLRRRIWWKHRRFSKTPGNWSRYDFLIHAQEFSHRFWKSVPSFTFQAFKVSQKPSSNWCYSNFSIFNLQGVLTCAWTWAWRAFSPPLMGPAWCGPGDGRRSCYRLLQGASWQILNGYSDSSQWLGWTSLRSSRKQIRHTDTYSDIVTWSLKIRCNCTCDMDVHVYIYSFFHKGS